MVWEKQGLVLLGFGKREGVGSKHPGRGCLPECKKTGNLCVMQYCLLRMVILDVLSCACFRYKGQDCSLTGDLDRSWCTPDCDRFLYHNRWRPS